MRKLVATLLILLTLPAAAQAHSLVHWHHNWHGHQHQVAVYHPPGLQYIAADDENCFNEPGFDMTRFMTAHGANVFRYIVPAESTTETYQGVPCVQLARSLGYKTQLAIAFNYTDTPQQVAAQVASVMQAYGPEWAVTIGNEEAIPSVAYIQDWNAAEPVLAKVDPSTIRVGGDAFPWQIKGSEDIIAARPVGMQAWALHCYDETSGQFAGGLMSVPSLAAYAAQYSIPIMCSEMAPATIPNSTSAGFFRQDSVASFESKVARVVKRSPNLLETSYYVWPSIGAPTY